VVFYFYISGHGFGHASRALEVVGALVERQPRARVVVRTSVAPWFLERSARAAIEIQPAEIDTGMAQIGSLRIDVDETARRAARFYATFEERVHAEASLLRSAHADVVVGDIPPVAFAAAARAGVPSVAIGNFTWDWIYSHYHRFERLAPGVVETIGHAYARADVALRLPFHGGFQTMGQVTRDIPLIARRSTRARADVRSRLRIHESRPVVLASFGAYGADIPIDEVARANDVTLIVTDHEAQRIEPASERVRRLTSADLAAIDVRYEDLVHASDVVVSKPGYGIVSECIANDAAFVYTSRDRFVEYGVFVAEMPRHLRCTFISQEDLASGRWSSAIERVLAAPIPRATLGLNGAEIAAAEILQRVGAEG